MTDRIKALVVTLDDDYRTDDVADIVTAINMIKGVVNVAHVPRNIDDYVNRTRIRTEILDKIYKELEK